MILSITTHEGEGHSAQQLRSPLMCLANWMSFGMMVTLLAWMAHMLVSSKRPTRYASDASCKDMTALDWKRRSVLKPGAGTVACGLPHVHVRDIVGEGGSYE